MPTTQPASPLPALRLGIEGFTPADLYDPQRLADLAQEFYRTVEKDDPGLGRAYAEYRHTQGAGLKPPEESELLLQLAHHLEFFLGRLFNVESEVARLSEDTIRSKPVFAFRTQFVHKRVLKRLSKGEHPRHDATTLKTIIPTLCDLISPSAEATDEELHLAQSACKLLHYEQILTKPEAISADDVATLRELVERLQTCPTDLSGLVSLVSEAELVKSLLVLLEDWTLHLGLEQSALPVDERWVSFWEPKPTDYQNLVEIHRPRSDLPQLLEGPEQHWRCREGFELTDARMPRLQVLGQANYCLFCSEREKDSCRHGFQEKDGSVKKNPLGIPLAGCPLDQRISEMHILEKAGAPVAALAMLMIDNPLCPGTGHRICNDCMKSCIYQKQTPVNIPQIETRILTDVVYELPWGFEIYSLLTRWNPLNVRRPHALPYNGLNVLVVGMGPAGYTLAHYLTNEGFGVVGMDGLKIEPWTESKPYPADFHQPAGDPRQPIQNYKTHYEHLEDRVRLGFGGVSEYGITVRWDKNFLNMIYLNLLRRDKFRLYGGIRFGGTLTIEDAWQMGLDHIAIAAGAGRPTVVEIKNNLIRNIRKASDFLMGLQLTGAGRKTALANLNVRLPALVIGGGLTGIDTCTEILAYYLTRSEKTLAQHEALVADLGKAQVLERLNPEERDILAEQLEHGRAIRAEREAARREGREPCFIPLLRQWGGATLVYRKSLKDAPAYRLNHEEITKALEEGIQIAEGLSPVEAHPDQYGAVEAVTFDVMEQVAGKWKQTGRQVKLPCRTLCVAAGTHPNTMYEREHPGTFERDQDGEFFLGYKAVRREETLDSTTDLTERAQGYHEEHVEESAAQWRLVPAEPTDRHAFFTSYHKNGRFISFFGDNHPAYEGNVVKAMSSAKYGFPHLVEVFQDQLQALQPQEQPAREKDWKKLADKLDDQLLARVERVNRLTPTIVEVVVRAPLAAKKFEPGQFYRLQNFETYAPRIEGTLLGMEGVALTGAWKDDQKGLLGMIVLELGASSRLCAALRPGEPVICMGPTGTPTEIPKNQKVLLAGGGLGNAVLFSIGKALRANGCQVLYFAGYRNPQDLFKPEEIEACADQVIWCSDVGPAIQPRRPQDRSFVANIVQTMEAYGQGKLGVGVFPLQDVQRIIAIGSDRMMNGVRAARYGVLAKHLNPRHVAIGSINSPMQCMMKEICAQCLQKHVDPKTGKPAGVVFSCFNQDQPLDVVDFDNLRARLNANSLQEKLAGMYLSYMMKKSNVMLV